MALGTPGTSREAGSGILTRLGVAVILLAFSAATLFCFVIYPRIATTTHAVLDPDGFGSLGLGVWHYGTLAYYPVTDPTLDRGPLYPFFIAAALQLSRGSWPQGVQAAQCVLFSLVTALVFWIAGSLWGPKSAVPASAVAALHPFLIWYTSRIWVEVLTTFLFTALLGCLLAFHLRPSISRGILLGVVLGLSALCKGTFLPFVLLVPALLGFPRDSRVRWRQAARVGMVAVLVLLPWLVRNAILVRQVVPVHLRYGYELQRGDHLADTYWKAPFALLRFWDAGTQEILAGAPPLSGSGAERELLLNEALLSRSLQRYRRDPLFLLKKMAINSWTFWTLGETELKSAVISLMQLPLLLAFVVACRRMWKLGRARSIQGVFALLVILYYLGHLPIIALARYSATVTPAMIICASGMLAAERSRRPSSV